MEDTPVSPRGFITKKQLARGITAHVIAAGANLMLCRVAMRAGTRLPVH